MFHACEHDSAALYHQFDITMKNVHDTQVSVKLPQAERSFPELILRHSIQCGVMTLKMQISIVFTHFQIMNMLFHVFVLHDDIDDYRQF